MSPAIRKTLYVISAPALAILVGLGIVNGDDAGHWAELAGTALGVTGLIVAASHTNSEPINCYARTTDAPPPPD